MDTRELRRQQVAQRFVDCTCKVIEQEGVTGLNVRKVAQMAGYHSSTIYLYFADFPHLIVAAAMQFLDRYAAYLDANVPEQENALDCYLRCMARFCEFSVANPNIFSALFVDSYGDIPPEQVYEQFVQSALLQDHIRVLSELAAELGLSQETAKQLGDAVMSLCIGSILALTRHRSQLPPDLMVEKTMQSVRGLIVYYSNQQQGSL